MKKYLFTIILRGDKLEVDITWIKNMQFNAKGNYDRGVIIEVPEEGKGGERLGPEPMEIMLMGIGTCTAADVIWIMNKSRIQLEKFELHLNAERATTDPKRFTKIHIEYVLSGKGLKDKLVARAIKLSQEKYCSATSSVAVGGALITASHRITPTE